MDDFLTPVSTTKVNRPEKPANQDLELPARIAARTSELNSADGALKVLKQDPNFDNVSAILKYLAAEAEKDKSNGFSLVTPDPVAANIAFELVHNTIPNYWSTLKERKVQENHLIRCLRNPCGIGHIIGRLRPLIADCRQKKPAGTTRDASSHVEDLLEVFERVLQDEHCSYDVWNDAQKFAKTAMQGKMIWKEYVAQVASGRILSLAAEAEDVLKEKGTARSESWLANGNKFAAWLGRNIAAFMIVAEKSDETASAVLDLCGKSLTLGYTGGYTRSSLFIAKCSLPQIALSAR
jgi:telomere length regulation protein